MEKKKVGFASGIGFILAAAGSAVGLGNLWGFPYKTSQNGGAAFVLIYIACVLLIGFVKQIERFVCFVLPQTEQEEVGRLQFISAGILSTSELSLREARK